MVPQKFVASSNLDAVGFQRGRLFIRFNSGASYAYDKVPFKVYQDLLAAESPGQFFHRNIRSVYAYEKLASDPFTAREKAA